jgi:hypothetical protein
VPQALEQQLQSKEGRVVAVESEIITHKAKLQGATLKRCGADGCSAANQGAGAVCALGDRTCDINDDDDVVPTRQEVTTIMVVVVVAKIIGSHTVVSC